jgi:protein TonB
MESAANANSNGELQSTATGPTAVSGPPASILDGQGGGHGGGSEGPMEASFGDSDGPRFIQRVMPKYPELARRRGREGLVVLRLVIGPGGDLRDAQVVEGGGHGFDEAALAAVRASVYAPATREGRGMECAALLPIRFALKGS